MYMHYDTHCIVHSVADYTETNYLSFLKIVWSHPTESGPGHTQNTILGSKSAKNYIENIHKCTTKLERTGRW